MSATCQPHRPENKSFLLLTLYSLYIFRVFCVESLIALNNSLERRFVHLHSRFANGRQSSEGKSFPEALGIFGKVAK